MPNPARAAEASSLLARLASQSEAPKYIRAYHGSPYDFDRFDASKIGTGEGAQAYGHGLYFAGNEDVARSYRDSLKDMVDLPVPDELDRQLMQVISEIRQLSGQRGKLVGGEWDAIQKQLDQKQDSLIDLQHQYRAAARNPGRMYEVQIDYPEEALLDYDRPMGSAIASRLTPALRAGLERGVRGRLEMGQLKRHADSLRQMMSDPSLAPGQLLWHGTADDYGAASAARKLQDAGVPGIRYLDQGSRSEGGGTRNYVMFPGTEDSIRILRKYGLMAPIPAAAAMSGGAEE